MTVCSTVVSGVGTVHVIFPSPGTDSGTVVRQGPQDAPVPPVRSSRRGAPARVGCVPLRLSCLGRGGRCRCADRLVSLVPVLALLPRVLPGPPVPVGASAGRTVQGSGEYVHVKQKQPHLVEL